MKRILLFLLTFALLGYAGSVLATTITLPNPLCPGGVGSAGCVNTLPDLITAITGFVATIAASLAVLMFLWAGILFLTSAGNEGRLANARKAVWWAVIGTGIALASYALVGVIQAIIPPPSP